MSAHASIGAKADSAAIHGRIFGNAFSSCSANRVVIAYGTSSVTVLGCADSSITSAPSAIVR